MNSSVPIENEAGVKFKNGIWNKLCSIIWSLLLGMLCLPVKKIYLSKKGIYILCFRRFWRSILKRKTTVHSLESGKTTVWQKPVFFDEPLKENSIVTDSQIQYIKIRILFGFYSLHDETLSTFCMPILLDNTLNKDRMW